jgi:hypothetical protein
LTVLPLWSCEVNVHVNVHVNVCAGKGYVNVNVNVCAGKGWGGVWCVLERK